MHTPTLSDILDGITDPLTSPLPLSTPSAVVIRLASIVSPLVYKVVLRASEPRRSRRVAKVCPLASLVF
jgi:hypothetical protein